LIALWKRYRFLAAYETFEDRIRMPRRFFLSFDKFFQAGRHNKELWDTAITRNNGRNPISFGPCIFEAHVHTTIHENYFNWLYQALSNRRVIDQDDLANNFKTEYDLEENEWPEKLACNACTDFPKDCELIFDLRTNRYNIVTSDLENVCSQQKRRIQEIVDKNKQKHKASLELLREKVKVERELPVPNTAEEVEKRKEISKEAKRKLRNFVSSPSSSTAGKDNDTTTPVPPSKKRYKRTVTPTSSDTRNVKTRVSIEKLDFFKEALSKTLGEKSNGTRTAWEMVYKRIVNEFIIGIPKENVGHKTEDFLLELSELDNNWKREHGRTDG
jgi:hypothetical protein